MNLTTWNEQPTFHKTTKITQRYNKVELSTSFIKHHKSSYIPAVL